MHSDSEVRPVTTHGFPLGLSYDVISLHHKVHPYGPQSNARLLPLALNPIPAQIRALSLARSGRSDQKSSPRVLLVRRRPPYTSPPGGVLLRLTTTLLDNTGRQSHSQERTR